MFGKSIYLFRLFGFQGQADMSWLVLAFLIIWTLTTDCFPFHYLYLSPAQYWGAGMIVLKDLLKLLAFRLDLEEMQNAT
ncbi:MAG: hypothetical protein CV088_20175 [Nitrospira sp. LK70]|nr:hypothetical protein [Nitrospira sp. LK70]